MSKNCSEKRADFNLLLKYEVVLSLLIEHKYEGLEVDGLISCVYNGSDSEV